MKKHWRKPELEVLEVSRTMLNTRPGNHLDHAYPEGTPRDKLTWS